MITALTDEGEMLDDSLVDILFELPAISQEADANAGVVLDALREERVKQQKRVIELDMEKY